MLFPIKILFYGEYDTHFVNYYWNTIDIHMELDLEKIIF